jgi:hypothetical protein
VHLVDRLHDSRQRRVLGDEAGSARLESSSDLVAAAVLAPNQDAHGAELAPHDADWFDAVALRHLQVESASTSMSGSLFRANDRPMRTMT